MLIDNYISPLHPHYIFLGETSYYFFAGKIYNELGLVYTQCADYIQAQKCFELALPLCRGPETNTKQEAVILQNLGATYNSLGEYQRAITFHESAMMMHGKN